MVGRAEELRGEIRGSDVPPWPAWLVCGPGRIMVVAQQMHSTCVTMCISKMGPLAHTSFYNKIIHFLQDFTLINAFILHSI